MEQKPILAFSAQSVGHQRDSLPSGGSSVHTPSLARQAQRVLPRVDLLESQFAEHIHLTDSPAGLTPEKVLVLEVAGSLSNFARAITQVAGFECLNEDILDRSFISEDFFALGRENETKPLTKTAYLTMSSQSGLSRLKSIWSQYTQTQQVARGNAPLRDAFRQLVDIRFWSTEDRLRNTHLLEDWQDRLNFMATSGEQDDVRFEIELWYRTDAQRRQQAEARVRNAVLNCGGRVEGSYDFEGIAYHALLGCLPADKVQPFIDSQGGDFELMRCDEVMYFRPLGQCTVLPFVSEGEYPEEILPGAESIDPDLSDQPIVALLDGLPLENHAALRGRISVDDPDDFESLYNQPAHQVHGTSMASLIVHGDLNKPSTALPQRLYVRPVMAPGAADLRGQCAEQIPSTVLPLDLMHRAVRRMKIGEGALPPTAPEVKIINLSIGDPYRRFDTQISPWARMIDWLSCEYDVLFILSAGNQTDTVRLEGISEAHFRDLDEAGRQLEFIKAIGRQSQLRRMLSPAEAVNALTIRAEHSDDFPDPPPANQFDLLADEGMPSPINPISLGVGRAVKPELMLPGGRQTFVNRTLLPREDMVFDIARSSRLGPGQKSASPGNTPGSVQSYVYTAGTSNAAAIATRRCAMLYETLSDLKQYGDSGALLAAPDAVILKAMLTHGAEFKGPAMDTLEAQFRTPSNSRTFKKVLNQWLGFGGVDEFRNRACWPHQATLLRTGVIKNDAADQFRFPMPICLAAKTCFRRLIITLAWMSPINCRHQNYRAAHLWVSTDSGGLELNVGDYYHHLLNKGTVFHEVRTGDRASVYAEGDNMVINVNCRAVAGYDQVETPYALMVTLDAPGSDLPIYEDVKAALALQTEETVAV